MELDICLAFRICVARCVSLAALLPFSAFLDLVRRFPAFEAMERSAASPQLSCALHVC